MQFAVPQFTDVEDRLIGSLTLKQFLVLLAAGGIILFFWSILGPSFPFFILSLPIAIAGLGAALGRFNGRPMFVYLLPFAQFLTSTKVMIFKREAVMPTVHKAPVKKVQAPSIPESTESTDSRLRKLAYLLDKKTVKEKQILSHDFREDLKIETGKTYEEHIVSNPIFKKEPEKKETERDRLQRVMELSRPASPIAAIPRNQPAEKNTKTNESKQPFNADSIFKF